MLSLNMDTASLTTYYIEQRPMTYPDLCINNTLIEKFNYFFLGLTISADLKWHIHVRIGSRKISKSSGVIIIY